jgi:hypothetical protein
MLGAIPLPLAGVMKVPCCHSLRTRDASAGHFSQIRLHVPLFVGLRTNNLSQIVQYHATAAVNKKHRFPMTTKMTAHSLMACVGCLCSQVYPCATSVLGAQSFPIMCSVLLITYMVLSIAYHMLPIPAVLHARFWLWLKQREVLVFKSCIEPTGQVVIHKNALIATARIKRGETFMKAFAFDKKTFFK